MRKRIWHKRLAGGLAVLVIIFLLPWASGVLFESQYRSAISEANKAGSLLIKITDYQRGWFHSHAKLTVQITDPDYLILLKSLNLAPSQLLFTIDQFISHGPIIATHYRGFNLRLGLADLRNLTKLTSTNATVMVDEDVVTLTGNYFKYFQTPPFDYMLDNNLHLQFLNGLSGNFHYYPSEKRISGNLDLMNFKADDGDVYLSIPNATMHYNQYKSLSDLWMGGLTIRFAEISGHDSLGGTFSVDGIDFDADTTETAGKISDNRRLDIDSMDFSHQQMGPLHMILSTRGLDASAIKEMIATYRKISLEGERYESQLYYKISMMLPRIFSQGSEIELNALELKTPIGMLALNGQLYWPVSTMSSPTTIGELLTIANAKGNLRISKALSDKLVSVAADLPYFRSITPEARRMLINMQTDVEMISQQNFLMISYFADQGLMTDEAAMQLINLQKNDVSLDIYSNAIKILLLKKQVMLAASYLLRWKYAAVRFDEDVLDQAALTTQESFVTQLRAQLSDWIKAGFVKDDKDDYVVELDKQGETIHLNGKDVD